MRRHLRLRIAAVLLAWLGVGIAVAQTGKLERLSIPRADHDPLYIDTRTVKWSGSVVEFRYVLDVPILGTTTDGGGPRFRSNEIEATLDCVRRTVKIGTVTGYSGVARTGEATGGYTPKPGESPPRLIGERKGNTMGYLFRYFCTDKSDATKSPP
jgi:hypothetical protein